MQLNHISVLYVKDSLNLFAISVAFDVVCRSWIHSNFEMDGVFRCLCDDVGFSYLSSFLFLYRLTQLLIFHNDTKVKMVFLLISLVQSNKLCLAIAILYSLNYHVPFENLLLLFNFVLFNWFQMMFSFHLVQWSFFSILCIHILDSYWERICIAKHSIQQSRKVSLNLFSSSVTLFK